MSPTTRNGLIKDATSSATKTPTTTKLKSISADSQIASSELLQGIDLKMDELTNFFKLETKKYERKVDELRKDFITKLKEHENRFMQSLSGISAQVANLSSDFLTLSAKYNTLSKRCDGLCELVDEQNSIISALENNMVSTDMIITNVPNAANANATVNSIINVINCAKVSVKKTFRIRNKSPDKYDPIIVKFASADDRGSFFKALADFRKKNKKQLQLCDAGLVDESNIYVHECLSKFNRQLLNAALMNKRNNLLSSAFTLKGYVFVRVKADDKAIKVRDVKALGNVVSGINTK